MKESRAQTFPAQDRRGLDELILFRLVDGAGAVIILGAHADCATLWSGPSFSWAVFL